MSLDVQHKQVNSGESGLGAPLSSCNAGDRDRLKTEALLHQIVVRGLQMPYPAVPKVVAMHGVEGLAECF